MKQVIVRHGEAVIEEVPAPLASPGTVLVRTACSCISVGTELSGLRMSGQPLWKRTLSQPEKVRKALAAVSTQGVARTWSQVEAKMQHGQPAGYSAAGVVVAVGEGVDDVAVGDRVACAGAQCAFHAEYVTVPRNLVVAVPDGVDWPAASTVALGAIALQGVRRAQPTLGETFVVIGLGLLGQLTVQLLRANGCRTIGTDLDAGRIELARRLGLDAALDPADGRTAATVASLTDGVGADGVIVTAAGASDAIIASAFAMCRKKGRVVLVGDVGLKLNRADLYEKELDFFISSSYGPGRYDRRYEEENLDYPVAFVRWTENRNMAEYLRLVGEGRLDLGPLVTAVRPVAEASRVYEELKAGAPSTMAVVFSYPDGADAPPVRRVPNPRAPRGRAGQVRLALVGAGAYATSTALPLLRTLRSRYQLRAIVDAVGHTATFAAKQFGAGYAATDYDELLRDPEVDAVYLITRHDAHARMALAALRAGKHVLVEKPLALTAVELDEIERYFADGERATVLCTGFNRRFSPYARRLAELVGRRTGPMVLTYRMNAGYIPPGHWVHGAQGGGRNLGEACHIYDLFTYLTGAAVASVSATPLRPASHHALSTDNFVATVGFDDGSVASLTYTALGTTDYPKEQLEVYCDGSVLVLSDYRELVVHGASQKGLKTAFQEKGQREELSEFADCLQRGGGWPIPLGQQLQAMRIALQVERALRP